MSDSDIDVDSDSDAGSPPSSPSTSSSSTQSGPLKFYWDLASPDVTIRQAAVAQLIDTIRVEQELHASNNDVSVNDPSLLLCPSLQYALTRLIRGLSSSRAAARQGFAAALTQLLIHFPIISTSHFISLIDRAFTITSQTNRQEIRDYHFGFLFAILVITQQPTRITELDTTRIITWINQILEIADKKILIRELCYTTLNQFITSIPYSRFVTDVEPILLKRLEGRSVSQLTCEEIGMVVTLLKIRKREGEKPSDLGKQHHLIKTSVRKCLIPKFFPHLAIPLADSVRVHPAVHHVWYLLLDELISDAHPDTDDINHHHFPHSSTSSWAQFYRIVVDEMLFHTNKSHARQYLGFQLMEYLLKKFTSGGAKGHISTAPTHMYIPLLFTKNLMRCLIIHLSKKDHVLYPCVQHVCTTLIHLVKQDATLALPIVSQLMGEYGSRSFDQITHTKTVATLLGSLDAPGIDSYIRQLFTTFLTATNDTNIKKSTDEPSRVTPSDIIRIWCIEQLYAISKNPNLHDENDTKWLYQILQFLFRYGFFNYTGETTTTTTTATKKKGKGKSTTTAAAVDPSLQPPPTDMIPISSVIRKHCSSRFMTMIGDLLPTNTRTKSKEEKKEEKMDEKPEKGKKKKQKQHDEDDTDDTTPSTQHLWVHRIHQYWNELELHGWTLDQPLDDDARETRTKMLSTVESYVTHINSSSIDAITRSKYRSLQLLLLHVGILQLTESDQATPLLQELEQVQSGAFDKKKTKTPARTTRSKKKKDEDQDEDMEEDEEKPVYIEVLVDILLSLLVKPITIFREIAKQGDDDDDEDVDDDDDDFKPFDIPSKNDTKSKKDDDDDEDEDEKEEDEKDEDEDEDEEEKNTKSNQKNNKSDKKEVHVAFKEVKDDDDEEDDDDEDEEIVNLEDLGALLDTEMDDEEKAEFDAAVGAAKESEEALAAHDAALANIVKLRNEKFSSAKELKRQSLHFKLRLLDLIEIFIRKQPSHPMILQLFLPLLDAVDASRTQVDKLPLHQRLVHVIKQKLCHPKEYPHVTSDGITIDDIRDMMTQLMERAAHTVDRETLSLISTSLLYLIRVSAPSSVNGKHTPEQIKKDHKQVSWIIQLYDWRLYSFLATKKTHFNTKFFTDFIQRCPALGFQLLDTLTNMATAPAKPKELKAKSDKKAKAEEKKEKKDTKDGKPKKLSSEERAAAKQAKLEEMKLATMEREKQLHQTLEADRGKYGAATPFLRHEAFVLMHTILSHKSALNESELGSTLATHAPATARSIITAIQLAIQQVHESISATSTSTSKPQGKKLRLAGGREVIPVKTIVNRMKEVFKVGNAVATLLHRTGQADVVSTVFDAPSFSSALESMPPTLATPLKGVLHNFYSSAKLKTPKLQIDNTTQQQKKDRKRKGGHQEGEESESKVAPPSKKQKITSTPVAGKSTSTPAKPKVASNKPMSSGEKRKAQLLAKDAKKKQKREEAKKKEAANKKKSPQNNGKPSSKPQGNSNGHPNPKSPKSPASQQSTSNPKPNKSASNKPQKAQSHKSKPAKVQ